MQCFISSLNFLLVGAEKRLSKYVRENPLDDYVAVKQKLNTRSTHFDSGP